VNVPNLHLSPRARKAQAFSLVEVVLAIGVTSFALLGMVALLPMGLKTSHQAADAMTEAQIVQYARNQLEMTPFTNLSTWVSNPLYFDNQGLPSTATDAQQIYKATFAIGDVQLSTSGSGAGSILGANANAPNAAADATLVQLTIVNRTMAGAAATNVFPIVVPNSGF